MNSKFERIERRPIKSDQIMRWSRGFEAHVGAALQFLVSPIMMVNKLIHTRKESSQGGGSVNKVNSQVYRYAAG